MRRIIHLLNTCSEKQLFLFGLLLYSISAWFSAGYFHPDEHFQILEFAYMKAGLAPASDLAWEYQQQIRPGLQPFLATLWIQGCKALGGHNPFYQAFGLRWISGILALWVYFKAIKVFSKDFSRPETSKLLYAAVVFLWFMPLISVRFSSENWSAISMVSGITLLYHAGQKSWKAALFSGLFIGLSFDFRFQSAFIWPGIAAWIWRYQKWPLSHWMALISGGSLALAAGAVADSWLYNTWTFTPWNYFNINILQHKAAEFGVSPWWFYVPEFLLRVIPPLSLGLLVLFTAGIQAARKHIWSWIILPFVLIHCLVAHKELRFLFPMAFPFLWIAALGWERLYTHMKSQQWLLYLKNTCLVINLALLLVIVTQPAIEFLPVYRYLYEHSQSAPRRLFAEKVDPYLIVGIKVHFYRPEQLEVRVVEDFNQLKDSTLRSGDLVLSRQSKTPEHLAQLPIKRVFSTFPEWILSFNFNDWQSRTRIWSVYEVQ